MCVCGVVVCVRCAKCVGVGWGTVWVCGVWCVGRRGRGRGRGCGCGRGCGVCVACVGGVARKIV